MKTYRVFLSAGEPSGDFLGSQLMKALKAKIGDRVTFVGLGGPLMAAEGLTSLFPIEELSLMGLVEIIPHIWRIRRRIQETVKAIETLKPDVVVTIDSPGFNFRVGKALKKAMPSQPLMHYVAPAVWAWKAGRAHKIAQFLDHLLVVLPFEPPYFLKENLPTTFVGHPVVELGLDQLKDPSFRKRYGIAPKAPILTLLPGSRRGEIARLLPVFQETAKRLMNKIPDLHIVIPTLPHLVDQIQQQLTIPATLVTTQQDKFASYKESKAALAASGTVALELAAAGTPCVVAYRINRLTYWMVRCMVKVKYACLINILMDKKIIPEYLQNDCTPEKLTKALGDLLDSDNLTRPQMDEAISKLCAPSSHESPSACAALRICQIIGSGC